MVQAPGRGLSGWDPGAVVLPGQQTCLVQGEGAPGAGTHGGHPLPQPHCLSFPAAEQAGSVSIGQSQGEFIQKCEGRMGLSQSNGCGHWMWLSPRHPLALHAMSPDPLRSRVCAWEATKTTEVTGLCLNPRLKHQSSHPAPWDRIHPGTARPCSQWATIKSGALGSPSRPPQTRYRARGITRSLPCSGLGLTQGCIHSGLGD